MESRRSRYSLGGKAVNVFMLFVGIPMIMLFGTCALVDTIIIQAWKERHGKH